jgi:F0F1-type ATP synthase assembly protein I
MKSRNQFVAGLVVGIVIGIALVALAGLAGYGLSSLLGVPD